MPIIPFQITCEECGTLRKETNNWFSTFRAAAGGLVIEALKLDQAREYAKSEYMMKEAKDREYKAHCGEACMHVFLSQSLSDLHK